MAHLGQQMVQTQRMEQRMVLTQRMLQAIRILQLPTVELEQYVQQELETNPVLEAAQQAPAAAEDLRPDVPVPTETEVFDHPFDLDTFASGMQDGLNFRPNAVEAADRPADSDDYAGGALYDIQDRIEGTDLSRNPDMDGRRQYYENSITSEESFSSRLLTQLRMAATSEQIYRIGERIIGDIDNRGYFTASLDDIAQELQVAPAEVENVLKDVIQRFEPTGVGARDVVECLLLQIALEYPDEPELRELVEKHLEDLEHHHIPKIGKEMGITPQRVEELKRLLSRLDPWPGHEYAFGPPQYVTPDVIVEKEDGEYQVYLSNEQIPELRVSKRYERMMHLRTITPEERQYLRGKIESGRWLINNILQRQRTIERIAKAIVAVQHEFLDNGTEYLKPLTLQEIADVVGVHEATVSRTTRGKYMQTPQGLFELKYFFSPGLKHHSGESQSNKSVQAMLKKLIDEEDKKKPLSDQKIADLLGGQGVNISRRTVTKYRLAMGVGDTAARKTY